MSAVATIGRWTGIVIAIVLLGTFAASFGIYGLLYLMGVVQ